MGIDFLRRGKCEGLQRIYRVTLVTSLRGGSHAIRTCFTDINMSSTVSFGPLAPLVSVSYVTGNTQNRLAGSSVGQIGVDATHDCVASLSRQQQFRRNINYFKPDY